MLKFLKSLFTSILGSLIALFIGFIFLSVIVFSLFSQVEDTNTLTVKENSVLYLNLSGEIPERTPKKSSLLQLIDKEDIVGINDIVSAIRRAKNDYNIKGIYIQSSFNTLGYAGIKEIQDALIDFKQSDKFIISYGEVYSQKSYYLASVSDSIFIQPNGFIEFNGLSKQIPFFKHTFEKLEIEPQIIKVGTYKSAVEPFILDKMSKESREQTERYLHSIHKNILNTVSTERNIDFNILKDISDKFLVRNVDDAVKYKLVDGIRYKDEVIELLKSKTSSKELSVVNISDYPLTDNLESLENPNESNKDKIAVVYAEGDIVDGTSSDEDKISSDRFAKTLRKLREDSTIKAVVLRVNSPGGSALASDVIWREVELIKNKKPIVVSMGDYAASGGYYISCAASKIVAQPNTITGSIGVFGIIPNMQKFLNNKLGITFDKVKTGEYSDIGTITRALSQEEHNIIQQWVNNTYTTFISKVSNGRGLSIDKVDSIAQGRVWTGEDALKIGLVDTLGNIKTAIDIASSLGNISDYKIVEYPKQKDILEELMNAQEVEVQNYFVKKQLGDEFIYYKQIQRIRELEGIQAILLD